MRLPSLIALSLLSASNLPSLCGAEVRVGVLGLFRSEQVTVKPAPGVVLRIRCGARQVFLTENRAAGLRAVGESVDLFAARELSTGSHASVTARDGGAAEFRLVIQGKLERRYRGRLTATAAGGRLTLIVAMDLETAVAAAAEAEIAADSPLEALKTMAVLARSYYTASRGRHREFDFCDTTHCQFHRAPPARRTAAWQAAAETAPLVLDYDGTLIAAMYSASCGGSTRSATEAGLRSAPYPYRKVECPPCLRDAPRWTRRLPLEAAARLLAERTESARLSVVRVLGWSAVPGNNFTVQGNGEEVVLEGRGEGHGVGVCQLGTIAMAKAGADFRTILLHYLVGVRLVPHPSN